MEAEPDKAEQLLQLTEDRYRLLAENVSDVIFTLDLNLRYTYCSPSVERLRGYTVEEVMTQTLEQVLTPASYQVAKKRLEGELARERAKPGASSESQTLELELTRKGGGTVWAEVKVSFLRDQRGDAVGILGVSRDITDRRRAKDRLGKQRQTFLSVLEQAPYGIVLVDRDGRCLYANSAFTEITGYTLDDIPTGREWFRKAYPDETYRKGVVVAWKTDLVGGEMTRAFRVLCKDQSLKEVEFKSAALSDGRAVTMLSDVTARKQAEEALHESEERYKSIVDNISVGIALITPAMEIVSMNNQLRKWFPSIDEAARSLCYEAFNNPPGKDVCPYCPTVKALDDGQVHEAVISTIVGDTIRHFRLISTPLKNSSGEVSALIELAEDITEQVQAAEAIRRLNEELEKRVVERTAELEATNKELEAFSYSVSHDLRAPLVAVEGFTRMLAERHAAHLPAEASRFVDFISKDVRRMQQLIDDLLAFSRVAHQRIEPMEVDMTDVATSVFQEFKQSAQDRVLQFVCNPLPASRGDYMMIRQVFANLLSNALKFTEPRKTARVEVGGWAEEEQNVYYVRDNGVGFDMEHADKLFKVFERLHSAEEFGGTGIGLSIVERIVSRHGGRVWAEGKPDEGATLYFALPREEMV
jgi:PAS domain S-box-containing protein